MKNTILVPKQTVFSSIVTLAMIRMFWHWEYDALFGLRAMYERNLGFHNTAFSARDDMASFRHTYRACS